MNTKNSHFKLFIQFIIVLFFINTSLTGKNKIKFAFLTDIHVAPNTPSEKALNDIIDEINLSDLNFVILTGDLTNNGSDMELLVVKKALDRLTIPCYVISGNHETNWSESAGSTFTKFWGEDRFVFDYEAYLFVGFATGPYMKMGDGQVKAEDLYWLERVLTENNAKNKILIVATHYPLTEGLANWYQVTDILNKHHAQLVLCGHGHRLSIYNFDGIPGIMGRATVKNTGKLPGYNWLELEKTELTIFEKEVGQAKHKFLSFDLNDKELIKLQTQTETKENVRNLNKNEFSANRPDYSINNEYSVIVKNEIIDSSSIFTSAVSCDNILVYSTSAGNLIAWDLEKKAIKWKQFIGGSVYSDPLIYKDLVIQGNINGQLHAFQLATGKEVWKLDLGKPILGEPLEDAGYLYLAAGNEMNKIAIDQGEVIWTNKEIIGQIQGRPTVSKNKLVFGAWDTYLYCLNTNIGTIEWKWTNGHRGVLLSPANITPAISKETVFIVAPDRFMTAIDLQNGKTRWRSNKHKVRESMGISEDGEQIYAKLMNDSIVAIATQTDSCITLWGLDVGFDYDHNPCPIVEHQGIIYAGGKNGLLVAIDKNKQAIKWKYKGGHSAINKITMDQKNGLWISLIEGKIINISIN